MTKEELFADPYLTVEEVAGLFEVKERTIRTWLREGKLNGTNPTGGRWLIQASEVKRFANEKYGD